MQLLMIEIMITGLVRNDEKVYTLDCFYDIFGVFLLREDESQQLLISKIYR